MDDCTQLVEAVHAHAFWGLLALAFALGWRRISKRSRIRDGDVSGQSGKSEGKDEEDGAHMPHKEMEPATSASMISMCRHKSAICIHGSVIHAGIHETQPCLVRHPGA